MGNGAFVTTRIFLAGCVDPRGFNVFSVSCSHDFSFYFTIPVDCGNLVREWCLFARLNKRVLLFLYASYFFFGLMFKRVIVIVCRARAVFSNGSNDDFGY